MEGPIGAGGIAEDHVAILQLMARYARGIDRLDPAMIRDAYWSDAIDDHGAFCGPPDAFVAWVCAVLQQRYAATGHFIGQSLIDVDGDEARVETAFRAWHSPRDPAVAACHVVNGRYLDILRRREGAWRIFRRRVVRDLIEAPAFNVDLQQPAGPAVGARGAADPSSSIFDGGL